MPHGNFRMAAKASCQNLGVDSLVAIAADERTLEASNRVKRHGGAQTGEERLEASESWEKQQARKNEQEEEEKTKGDYSGA
ncbi:hypothetical protein NDU88_007194 [Pleurodeles waltl]|uniref:Uncharacterized protein n=1 Tax=Pleurodeles waltl TaxID=8319 RepID=A0AAV7MPK6_PLEWA|nr:hypothetical protein NDU88_007194 [Pleurodeles waltl]